SGGPGATACKASRALTSASARPAGRGLKIRFSRSVRRPVQVDVFQESHGRRVLSERLVARFTHAKPSFTWNGRANRAGKPVTGPAARTIRLRFSQNGRPRGDYKVTVRAARGSRSQARTLTSRKL